MSFPFDTLRDYLWHQFNIAPELISLDTHFQHDLYLTDGDVEAIVRHLSQAMGAPLLVDTVEHLTDVFDLVVYVLLRSLEENGHATYVGEPAWPIDNLPGKKSLSLSEIMHQQTHLN